MRLCIKQSEIDTAIRLCDEHNQSSSKQENENYSASEIDKAREFYKKNPSQFDTFLKNLEEVKLTELAAIMHYGRGKSFSFDNFEQSLEHCSSMPEAARRSEIYTKTLTFAENVEAGLGHLRDEGYLPSKTN